MSQHSFRTVVAAVATVAVVGVVGLAAYHLASHHQARATDTSSRSGAGHAAALAQPSPSPSATPSSTPTPTAAPSDGKASSPSPPATVGGQYPYPMDAGGTVVTGQLSLSPTRVGSGGSSTITISASRTGWMAGQQIFIFLGQRYELTLSAPGSSAQLEVASSSVNSSGVVISGFQFPGNSPAAPIDGYGTATLGAA